METKTLSAVGALVLELGKQLVDRPSQVRIWELTGQQATLLELSVCRSDFGKILGKGGRTASNVRTLLACISGRAQRRFTMEFLEPEEAPAGGDTPEAPVKDPVPGVVSMLTRLLVAMVDNPSEVSVKPLRGDQLVLFEVLVHPHDVKLVLGRGGKSAIAARELVQNIGVKHAGGSGWMLLTLLIR